MFQTVRPSGRSERDRNWTGLISFLKTNQRKRMRSGSKIHCIFFSDFLMNLKFLKRFFTRLNYERYLVNCFQILSPDEIKFPFKKTSHFRSLQNPENVRFISGRKQGDDYRKRMEDFQKRLKILMAQNDIPFAVLDHRMNTMQLVQTLLFCIGQNQFGTCRNSEFVS